MEDHEHKKVKSPGSVLGSIAGKIASTSHLVRDKTEQINSKVHDHWAKTNYTPTKTVDEEFEDLVEELEALTDACHEIIKLHRSYIEISSEIVLSSQKIASSYQVLSGQNVMAANSGVLKTDLCERTKSYNAALVEIGICLRETLCFIPKLLDERIRKWISYSEKINERVAVRDKALTAYDKVYDKFDAMTILSAGNELTSKQKQEYSSLEKKLAELKETYDGYNTQLKNELPQFFKLMRAFMQPLMTFLFYIHLSAAYQTQSNLESIALPSETDDLFSEPVLPSFQSKFFGPFPGENQDKVPDISLESLLQIPTETNNKRRKAPDPEDEPEYKRPTSSRSSEGDGVIGYCRAISNCSSIPGSDLEFKKGDLIGYITCEGEWWTGICGGKYGSFPSSYVEKF